MQLLQGCISLLRSLAVREGEEKVDLVTHYLGADILFNIDLDAVLVKFMKEGTAILLYVSCDEMKGYDIFLKIK